MKTGIAGYGWVGKSMHRIFPESIIFDPIIDGSSQNKINGCDIVFICVPTPSINRGKLDTSIVEEVISWCKASLIVVRSTVNPGDCDRWSKQYNANIIMQPEYLGESTQHPLVDETKTPFIIIGGKSEDRRRLIELYQTAYNSNIKIRQVSSLEAEVIKLSENRAIAFKVAECQELYDACEAAGVDYYTIRDAVYGDDPRFNLWWTFVFPDKRGFNSKCIPKDIYAWCAWAESAGYRPRVTRTILERNNIWIRM